MAPDLVAAGINAAVPTPSFEAMLPLYALTTARVLSLVAPFKAPAFKILSAACSAVSLPTVFSTPLEAADITALAEAVAVDLAPV